MQTGEDRRQHRGWRFDADAAIAVNNVVREMHPPTLSSKDPTGCPENEKRPVTRVALATHVRLKQEKVSEHPSIPLRKFWLAPTWQNQVQTRTKAVQDGKPTIKGITNMTTEHDAATKSASLNLRQTHWTVILDTFRGVTKVPLGRAKVHLCTAIIEDTGRDEWPDYDPWDDPFMAPFVALTESQATTALKANNTFWTTQRMPWDSDAAVLES